MPFWSKSRKQRERIISACNPAHTSLLTCTDPGDDSRSSPDLYPRRVRYPIHEQKLAILYEDVARYCTGN